MITFTANSALFAPSPRPVMTTEQRDAINAINAALYATSTYDGDLFADMFGADA